MAVMTGKDWRTDFGIADLRRININSAAIQFLELMLAAPGGKLGVDGEGNKNSHKQ